MVCIIEKYCTVILIFNQLFYHECVAGKFPYYSNMMKDTHEAAIYPGSKKTGLKLVFSESGTFNNLLEAIKMEGFLRMGLFCVQRGAFILYRKPYFNIDNAEDFQIASGENRCFTPTEFESAQPIGPLNMPKKDSITFFTQKNFASMAYPTAFDVTRSFFASIKSSIQSIITIGKKRWTIITATGNSFCIQPTDFDAEEKYPICMLSDLSATKIKHSGINIVKVLSGCLGANVTIDANICSYWGAVPDASDGSKTLVEDTDITGRDDQDVCGGGGDKERLLRDTLYYFKTLITDTFDKSVVLDFNGATNLKWKLEMLDMIFAIAKQATSPLVSDNYLNRIREFFVSDLANAWRRRSDQKAGNSGGKDEIVVGLLTEYDYRGLLYQTNQCLGLISEDQAKSNWAAWQDITNATATEEKVWKGLLRKPGHNIVIEMTWVIMNMVGGLCHRLFGYAHNYWAMYIHFVLNMYLTPVADLEWIHPAEMGDMNIILGGDMEIQYNKLAVFASVALYDANSLEPFQRPITGSKSKSDNTG